MTITSVNCFKVIQNMLQNDLTKNCIHLFEKKVLKSSWGVWEGGGGDGGGGGGFKLQRGNHFLWEELTHLDTLSI